MSMLHNILIYRDKNDDKWKYLITKKNEEMEDVNGYLEVLDRITMDLYDAQDDYLDGLESINHDADCEQCSGISL